MVPPSDSTNTLAAAERFQPGIGGIDLGEAVPDQRQGNGVLQREQPLVLDGLADAALLETAAKDVALLTTDFDLYNAALKKGAKAFNFNHLRDRYL